jgi:bifunctional polynucleotide phosphatase/kinase
MVNKKLIDNTCVSYKSPKFVVDKDIACFDIDYTIIKTKSGRTFPKDTNDWELLYDNTKDVLKKLSKNYNIVFISNQAGIGKGKIKLDDWYDKVKNIINKLGIPVCVYASIENDKYRKPSPGMWQLFLDEFKLPEDIAKNSFYCGDAAGRVNNWKKGVKKDFSDSDRKFAINSNLKFYCPEEIFLGEKKISKSKWELKGLNPNDIPQLTINNKTVDLAKIIKNKQQLVINVGYPGSGKSTYTKQFEKYGWVVANQDTCKTLAKCIKLCKETLLNKKNIVIDNTNADIKTREKYIEIAKSINKNIYITCLHFTTPMEISQHNNKYRNYISNNLVKRIPDLVYYVYRKKFVEPNIDEGFNKIINIPFVLNNISKEYYMYYS